MLVIGISGSPRRGGNTELLLDEFLRGAEMEGANTEKIVVSELSFSPCRECNACDSTGMCVLDDEMQGVYRRLKRADVIVLASPIFFMSLTAQLKALIDRCQCLWVERFVLGGGDEKNRKGFFISVGGSSLNKLFNNARSVAKAFFNTLNAEYAGELLYPEVDEKGAITEHPTALKDAFELGGNAVQPSA